MQTIEFSRSPNELSCIIGNLFERLEPPCRTCDLRSSTHLVLCGVTHNQNYGRLTIQSDRCVFDGEPGDLAPLLNGHNCPERGRKNG